MDNQDRRKGSPRNCLVCSRSEPETEWVDELYDAQPCRFCSPHCQARFEAGPQNYIAEGHSLLRPLGYS